MIPFKPSMSYTFKYLSELEEGEAYWVDAIGIKFRWPTREELSELGFGTAKFENIRVITIDK